MIHSAVAGKSQAILTDVTKCIGCHRCVEACIKQHQLPPDLPFRTKQSDGLSGRRFTAVLQVPHTTRTVRKHCLHCLEPSCVSACPTGALAKRPDGPVFYLPEKCIGCRYCLLACPFNIPRYEWEKRAPHVRKCKMDEDCRVESGTPACVAACPTGATIFGGRQELLKEARRRIAQEPKRYIPRIWGEEELGGTAVLYLSDVDLNPVLRFPLPQELEKNDLAELQKTSLPRFNRPWIQVTPLQAGVVFTSLWGIWLIRRRQLLKSGNLKPGRGKPAAASLEEEDQAESAGEEGNS